MTDLSDFESKVKLLRSLRAEWQNWKLEERFARDMVNPLATVLEDGCYTVIETNSKSPDLVTLQAYLHKRKVTLQIQLVSASYDGDDNDGFCFPSPPPFPKDKWELLTKLEAAIAHLHD
jgi:hypothetical protein